MKSFIFIALILTASVASADNYRKIKIADHLGRSLEIVVKNENIQETFHFNTLEIFREIKKEKTKEMIDITPFIKPEKEVEENLPLYVK
jgi:hypothetical protein